MDEQRKSDRILQLVQQLGVLRPKDLAPHHIQAEYLRRLCDKGVLKKLGRGSYVLAERKLSPALDLALVARAVPNGVICLQSALSFHGISTETPPAISGAISVAIERRAAKPRLDYPPLHIVRLGDRAFSDGSDVYQIESVDVRVYSVEKTLADLFKFRNKIGPHIAVDALRAALAQFPVDRNKLHHYAKLCRVERVMKPYVDALMYGQASLL